MITILVKMNQFPIPYGRIPLCYIYNIWKWLVFSNCKKCFRS